MSYRADRNEFSEADKVNCPFYHKIGACRHGDTCNRTHHKPPFSQTVLIRNCYMSAMIPIVNAGGDVSKELDPHTYQMVIDDFYEEMVEELSQFGQLEDVQVVENLNDHMIGSVYAKYLDEEDAESCLAKMHGRSFAGRVLSAAYSSCVVFEEARCRVYDDGGDCRRGAYCNFMHVATPSAALRKHIDKTYKFTTCTRGTGTMSSMGGGSSGGGGDRRDMRSRDRRGGERDYRDRDYRRDRSRSRDRQ
eukprot:GSChrysophyteH2.ASY1.ANO1.1438.1 assembled CDS